MNAPLPPTLLYPHPLRPEAGRVIEVADGVYWLRMPLPFALDHINLWLLADEIDGVRGWTAVDTGFGDAATRAVWETQFANTLGGRPLLRVIVTHYHPDHVGNAAWLLERARDPLPWMTQGEFYVAHLVWHRLVARMEEMGEFFRTHGMPADDARTQSGRSDLYRVGVPALPQRFRRIFDRQTIVIGGCDWRVIVGHGHAPEHAALFCASLNVLVAGDMLLPRISTNVSVGTTDPDGDPLRLFLESISAFTELPDDALVLPSHGLPFIGIGMRVAALHEHHRARLGELHEASREHGAITAHDVLPVLFKRPLDVQQQFFAMGESIAHLNHLWHRGRLARTSGRDDVVRFSSI